MQQLIDYYRAIEESSRHMLRLPSRKIGTKWSDSKVPARC